MSAPPWMKFYPRDWRGDQALRAVSLAARGLWIDCLCIMHEAQPYGHLVLGSQPVTDVALARMTGTTPDQISELLGELESAAVFARRSDGTIYSRRMTRDFKKAKIGEKSAKKRWSQAIEKQEENCLPNRGPIGVPTHIPITQIPDTRDQKERKIPKPDGFGRVEPVAEPEAVLTKPFVEEPLPNPKQRLWGEGVQALVAMGVGEKQARPIIGRWLRDCGDDAMRVLDAIQRARDHAPMDPVPWITAGFTKAKSNRKASDERKAALQDAIGPNLYEIAANVSRSRADGLGGRQLLALESPG